MKYEIYRRYKVQMRVADPRNVSEDRFAYESWILLDPLRLYKCYSEPFLLWIWTQAMLVFVTEPLPLQAFEEDLCWGGCGVVGDVWGGLIGYRFCVLLCEQRGDVGAGVGVGSDGWSRKRELFTTSTVKSGIEAA